MRWNYVYRVDDPASGRYYIGKRTSVMPPHADPYTGSGLWPSRARKAGVALVKTVLAVCPDEMTAYALERWFVEQHRDCDPFCMNLADGGRGLTSRVAKVVMNRPERRAIAREVALRDCHERVRVMQRKTTPAQRSAGGRAGGLAGKGVSRNAGDANPMRRIPSHLQPGLDKTAFVLRRLADGGEWRGTKREMNEQLGESTHWYSLCSGKRKVCRGYELVGRA